MDDTNKGIFFYEFVICIKMSLKIVSKDPVNSKPALV